MKFANLMLWFTNTILSHAIGLKILPKKVCRFPNKAQTTELNASQTFPAIQHIPVHVYTRVILRAQAIKQKGKTTHCAPSMGELLAYYRLNHFIESILQYQNCECGRNRPKIS